MHLYADCLTVLAQFGWNAGEHHWTVLLRLLWLLQALGACCAQTTSQYSLIIERCAKKHSITMIVTGEARRTRGE